MTDLQYPVHAAAREGRLYDLACLLEYRPWDVNQATFELVRPLHEACLHGKLSCAKLLIDRGADVNLRNIDGATALADACLHGNEEIVALLLEQGADVNPPFLMSTPVHEAVFKDNWKCLELILSYGADLNKSDCHYGTPLHVAAFKGHARSASVLLKAGAEPNVTKHHLTPLHEAARCQELEVIQLLLEHGANIYSRNNHGLTARQLVPSSTSPCKVLLKEWEETPKTLRFHCRLAIRKFLGRGKLASVKQFGIPSNMAKYLQFE